MVEKITDFDIVEHLNRFAERMGVALESHGDYIPEQLRSLDQDVVDQALEAWLAYEQATGSLMVFDKGELQVMVREEHDKIYGQIASTFNSSSMDVTDQVKLRMGEVFSRAYQNVAKAAGGQLTPKQLEELNKQALIMSLIVEADKSLSNRIMMMFLQKEAMAEAYAYYHRLAQMRGGQAWIVARAALDLEEAKLEQIAQILERYEQMMEAENKYYSALSGSYEYEIPKIKHAQLHCEKKIEAYQQRIDELGTQLQTVSKQIADIQKDRQVVADKLEEVVQQESNVLAEVEGLEQRGQLLESQLNDLDEISKAIEAAMDELERDIEDGIPNRPIGPLTEHDTKKYFLMEKVKEAKDLKNEFEPQRKSFKSLFTKLEEMNHHGYVSFSQIDEFVDMARKLNEKYPDNLQYRKYANYCDRMLVEFYNKPSSLEILKHRGIIAEDKESLTLEEIEQARVILSAQAKVIKMLDNQYSLEKVDGKYQYTKLDDSQLDPAQAGKEHLKPIIAKIKEKLPKLKEAYESEQRRYDDMKADIDQWIKDHPSVADDNVELFEMRRELGYVQMARNERKRQYEAQLARQEAVEAQIEALENMDVNDIIERDYAAKAFNDRITETDELIVEIRDKLKDFEGPAEERQALERQLEDARARQSQNWEEMMDSGFKRYTMDSIYHQHGGSVKKAKNAPEDEPNVWLELDDEMLQERDLFNFYRNEYERFNEKLYKHTQEEFLRVLPEELALNQEMLQQAQRKLANIQKSKQDFEQELQAFDQQLEPLVGQQQALEAEIKLNEEAKNNQQEMLALLKKQEDLITRIQDGIDQHHNYNAQLKDKYAKLAEGNLEPQVRRTLMNSIDKLRQDKLNIEKNIEKWQAEYTQNGVAIKVLSVRAERLDDMVERIQNGLEVKPEMPEPSAPEMPVEFDPANRQRQSVLTSYNHDAPKLADSVQPSAPPEHLLDNGVDVPHEGVEGQTPLDPSKQDEPEEGRENRKGFTNS